MFTWMSCLGYQNITVIFFKNNYQHMEHIEDVLAILFEANVKHDGISEVQYRGT